MNRNCTVVMYHYVRDLKHSRFPRIKGLDLNLFYEQIEYLQKNYTIIKIAELIGAIENDIELPPNACLLTFDDAYADHYTNVFPFLEKKKLEGSFYVPVMAVTENQILDVNKIHFILAANENTDQLIKEIFLQMDQYRSAYDLHPNDYYYRKLAVANRFDTPQVIFIKRLLQVELAEDLRRVITDVLFQKFVSADEAAFSRELYMSVEQIECMQRNGMHIGAHGNNHYWLGALSKELQRNELEKSLQFVKKIGGNENSLTLSYPYGNYNEDTLDLLKSLKYKLAFTTRVETATASRTDRFELPRFDTNDFPTDRHAAAVQPA